MARRPKPWYRTDRDAWFVTIDGTQHNLGPDKKQAFKLFHELMREPKRAEALSRSLVGIIDDFLEWTQKNRAPKNYEQYRYRLQRFVERYPDLQLHELRPYHVSKWADSYNISRTSKRNYLRAVKRCMKWATEEGYIDSSPIAGLRVPAGESRDVVIRQDEFDRLLSFVQDDSFRDLLLSVWETGCRPQEILKITAHHVDLANQRWVLKKSESKMKRLARVIYLGEKTTAITTRLVASYPTGPIYRNSRGTPWTPCAVNCVFRRIRVSMGRALLPDNGKIEPAAIREKVAELKTTRTEKGKVRSKTEKELVMEAKRKIRTQRAAALAPGYSLYILRHSFATNALERGLDALTVAVLMGHRDPSMLARVYQHLAHNPKHLLEQARRATAVS